jgi:hypothetical protein
VTCAAAHHGVHPRADPRTCFAAIPAEGSNAADIGYPEMRVTKRSGVVAAWGRRDTQAHRTPA